MINTMILTQWAQITDWRVNRRHSADSTWVLRAESWLTGSSTAVLRRDQVYYGTISTDKVHHLPSSQSLFISLEGAVVDVGVDGCHRWWVSTLPSPWYIPARDEIRSLIWSPRGPTNNSWRPVLFMYIINCSVRHITLRRKEVNL